MLWKTVKIHETIVLEKKEIDDYKWAKFPIEELNWLVMTHNSQ